MKRIEAKEGFCGFCEVMLSSRFGSKTRTKYCDDCATLYRTKLINTWQRRKYQKRMGLPMDRLISTEVLKRKRGILDDARLAEYKKLRDAGASFGQIGKSYGISRQAVHKAFKLI